MQQTILSLVGTELQGTTPPYGFHSYGWYLLPAYCYGTDSD